MKHVSDQKILWLSHFLGDTTPGYRGGRSLERKALSSIAEGACSNSESWSFPNHVGTHVDCPLHFNAQGKSLSDYLPGDWVFQNPFLLEIPANSDEIITVGPRWAEVPGNCDLLLVKTGFEKFRGTEKYWRENPGLSPDLGQWLRKERKLQAIGFDFLSLTAYAHRELGRTAHRAFLGEFAETSPLRIIEDMHLESLSQSPKSVVVAPLQVEKGDGGPVSALAFLEEIS